MDHNETINERKARESAERLAQFQRDTARPRVPTRDDFVMPTFGDYHRKEAANDERMAAVERQKQIDWHRRMYPGAPLPKELQDGGDAA